MHFTLNATDLSVDPPPTKSDYRPKERIPKQLSWLSLSSGM